MSPLFEKMLSLKLTLCFKEAVQSLFSENAELQDLRLRQITHLHCRRERVKTVCLFLKRNGR